ncbi:MAG: B12-binding domain-containing radical SAM protein [Oscillospiraceae bacterium]|nr:B12-binding domain-containing radical SAM protein [Oscillospiraceae bacterium]
MKKVVILAINAKYIHTSLSARVLAEGVSRYSKTAHEVIVIEANINQGFYDIADLVTAHNPVLVGISTYIWNAGMVTGLLKLFRSLMPETALVPGGPEAAHNAEYWLEAGADFVLQGEGEQSFPALLDALANKTSLNKIPGLCFKKDGLVFCNAEVKPSKSFITPDFESFSDELNGRIAYIETSRGCPFSCAYCLSGGSEVKFLPLETAKEQIRKLAESNAKVIKFTDRTFNCSPKRAYELFEYIIGLNTSRCFHFEAAADLFDGRTIELLATAPPGRIQFEIGLQSFFEPALKAVCRQTDLTRAEENIRALLSHQNIHIHIDLIAGLPLETLSDFKNSFERAYALNAHNLQLGFLKLLHGSKIREQNTSIVYSKEPPYEIISSPWLSTSDLKMIKQAEDALRNTYNKGRFLSTLRYIAGAAEIRPFALFQTIGEAAPAYGVPLKYYAEQIYILCRKLKGVDEAQLRECMIYDWFRAVKYGDLPDFLKTGTNEQFKKVIKTAEITLGRKIRRNEAAVLPSGKGIFADSESRDPVTGLYEVQFIGVINL